MSARDFDKKSSNFKNNKSKSTSQLAAENMMNTPLMQQQKIENDSIFGNSIQLQSKENSPFQNASIQKKENNTGIPDNLKSGMENLSGMSLDNVKVHYNSNKPAAVQAHAYAQGNNIHIASGQEKHLPHELGHVVQQAQGRVKPTTTIGGMAVNDNPKLESEATAMGNKAMQMQDKPNSKSKKTSPTKSVSQHSSVTQKESIIQKEEVTQREEVAQMGFFGKIWDAAKGAYEWVAESKFVKAIGNFLKKAEGVTMILSAIVSIVAGAVAIAGVVATFTFFALLAALGTLGGGIVKLLRGGIKLYQQIKTDKDAKEDYELSAGMQKFVKVLDTLQNVFDALSAVSFDGILSILGMILGGINALLGTIDTHLDEKKYPFAKKVVGALSKVFGAVGDVHGVISSGKTPIDVVSTTAGQVESNRDRFTAE